MDYQSDLVSASEDGNIASVQAILNQPRKRWKDQLTASLGKAVWRSDQQIVDLLLSKGAKLDISSYMGLLNRGSIDVFEVFYKHGLDLNTLEFGEPIIRISSGKPDLIMWLLAHGADPNLTNERGVSALSTIAIKGLQHEGMVFDILLANGARMEPDILHRCIRPTATGGPEMLEFLIDRGADVNHITEENGTLLHSAAFLGMEEQVRILLDAGAKPDVVIDGETPASLAKRYGHENIYDLLISKSSGSKSLGS